MTYVSRISFIICTTQYFTENEFIGIHSISEINENDYVFCVSIQKVCYLENFSHVQRFTLFSDKTIETFFAQEPKRPFFTGLQSAESIKLNTKIVDFRVNSL